MMATDLKYYKFFADYIAANTGIIYQEKDYYRLDARFKTLTQAFEVESIDDVYQLFQGKVSPQMHQFLIDISTNNETYFMRDTKPFKALIDEVLPELWPRSHGQLNIWSCACSTGQEVLSILMSIAESGHHEWLKGTKVFATDISSKALEKATSGVYDHLDVQRGLPATNLVKYFSQTEGEKWKFDPIIHSKVEYKKMNLLEFPYSRKGFDIIFCRNVLIYQDREKKEKILEQLYSSLKPGGYFFMGSGESMIGIKTDFKPVKLKDTLIYQRPLT